VCSATAASSSPCAATSSPSTRSIAPATRIRAREHDRQLTSMAFEDRRDLRRQGRRRRSAGDLASASTTTPKQTGPIEPRLGKPPGEERRRHRARRRVPARCSRAPRSTGTGTPCPHAGRREIGDHGLDLGQAALLAAQREQLEALRCAPPHRAAPPHRSELPSSMAASASSHRPRHSASIPAVPRLVVQDRRLLRLTCSLALRQHEPFGRGQGRPAAGARRSRAREGGTRSDRTLPRRGVGTSASSRRETLARALVGPVREESCRHRPRAASPGPPFVPRSSGPRPRSPASSRPGSGPCASSARAAASESSRARICGFSVAERSERFVDHGRKLVGGKPALPPRPTRGATLHLATGRSPRRCVAACKRALRRPRPPPLVVPHGVVHRRAGAGVSHSRGASGGSSDRIRSSARS